MDDEWIDRQALLDAGLDPDDPDVWEAQRQVRQLMRWYAVQSGWRRPDEPG